MRKNRDWNRNGHLRLVRRQVHSQHIAGSRRKLRYPMHRYRDFQIVPES